METRHQYEPDTRQKKIQELVDEYDYLVEYIANRLMVDLPPSVEREDLIAEGRIGLIDAFNRFDPDRDVKFETYASIRVRGAMVDYLRSLDWSPRSLRRKAREIGQAQEKLQQELGRSPEDEEVAEELDMELDEYHSLLSEISRLTILGFYDDSDDEEETKRRIPEDEENTPVKAVDRREMKRNLSQAIERLDEREQKILECYYNRGMSLKDIGEMFDLTESRICQIHGAVISKLREILSAWREG